jgi:hypothetical protein
VEQFRYSANFDPVSVKPTIVQSPIECREAL